ncbi:Outer membrane protein (porin) [Citrobacter freundii]|nr:Outer membrane protein (porin) [Citrobacter freundii]
MAALRVKSRVVRIHLLAVKAEAIWGGRIGIYLTRDLDILPETKIVGRLEWQVRTEKNDNNTGESDMEARYSYVGLSNKTWGELITGRTKNPLYQVMKMTDKYKKFHP